MHLEARVFLQPRPHLRVFVRGVIINDQMQVEVARRLAELWPNLGDDG